MSSRNSRGRIAPADPWGAILDDHAPDTGCNESPKCLTCPLPVCRFDDPVWYIRLNTWRRDVDRVAILADYRSMAAASRATGIVLKTLERAKDRIRAGEPVPS